MPRPANDRDVGLTDQEQGGAEDHQQGQHRRDRNFNRMRRIIARMWGH
jgi:hypothetical protein